MDPIIEILQQINELSGAALDALTKQGGGGEGAPPAPPGGAPAPAEGEQPAE